MRDIMGSLTGVVRTVALGGGAVQHCTLDKRNEINTRCGVLVPRYGEMNVRRRNNSSMSFYENGAVKRIALEQQTLVVTPLGKKPAELVTFYQSGALKRFFPLDGQISGYWSEQDEEGLLETLNLTLPSGELRAKIIGCCFYENGAVRSLTLWPTQTVQVDAGFGLVDVRHGLSFYKNGKLQSLEPARETAVLTPAGILKAYDASAVGVHGDVNSLVFDERGHVAALTVPGTVFKAFCDDGRTETIAPLSVTDPLDNESVIEQPVKVSFSGDSVSFESGDRKIAFNLRRTRIFTVPVQQAKPRCAGTNCSQCQMCK